MSIADSETLKHQFQLIQEQQQKKLLARKQKKASAKETTAVSTKDGWGLEDDLELKVPIFNRSLYKKGRLSPL